MDTKTYRTWVSTLLLGLSASCAVACGGATDDGPTVANTVGGAGGANDQGGSGGDTSDPGGSGGSTVGKGGAGQAGKGSSGKGGSQQGAGKGGTNQGGSGLSGKGGSGGSGPGGGQGGKAAGGSEQGGAEAGGSEQGGQGGAEAGGSEQGGQGGVEAGGSEQGGQGGVDAGGSEQGGQGGVEAGGSEQGGAGQSQGGAGAGGGMIGAPDGWTCNAAYYNEGASGLCDCDCGPHDPDCDVLGTAVSHCPSDKPLCDQNDHCAAAPPPPAGWTCDPAIYGDGLCDCSCGVLDADCKAGQVADHGCNSTQVCDAQGACAGGTPTPPGWTCPADYFADGTYCDCDCGAYDLDCKDPNTTPGHCNGTQTCNPSNGVCTGGIPTPPAWTCKHSDFADGFTCDCNCGAHDPDCDNAANGLYGCNPSNTACSPTGECTGGMPTPKGWTCDASFFADGTTCDCGCGVRDADCDVAALAASDASCPVGKTCTHDEVTCH